MKTKKLTKKIISIIVTIALIMSYLPTMLTAAAAAGDTYNRVADPSTMDGWKNYFDLSNLDTSNAGGVWTDKSVFTDASAFPNSVTMIDDGKNFLTALSAIAANKEVVGYSTVPTDTVFVLDLSQSMTTSDVRDLVDSTNAAMKKLLATNNNNRVGVVLYSGETSYDNSVSRLLPIDRYTTTRSDGNFIQFSSNRVSVYSGVSGTSSFGSTSRTVGGGTYIQAGLWEAWKMFSEVPDDDIYIGNDNWQSGEYRMPIVVLMTDGAPTRGTNSFANVGNSNVGNGYPYGIREGDAFLVQLTASYVKNSIENKYKVKESYGAGRSLFYTLGFNIAASQNPNTANDNNIAYSVVNPEGTTLNDAYWNSYNNNNSVQVTVTSTRGSMTTSSA
ncbi:MAG: VWA domain-containing protein, partial [Clostridia bacterium]|nr:VWA domain-containing protein [Clostridia bacterium]